MVMKLPVFISLLADNIIAVENKFGKVADKCSSSCMYW
jgi:hypothetical protein